MREDWRYLKFESHIEPPSWVLSDLVHNKNYTGILFPSQTNEGGANIVVFLDRIKNDNKVEVNDPLGQLSRDQASWLR